MRSEKGLISNIRIYFHTLYPGLWGTTLSLNSLQKPLSWEKKVRWTKKRKEILRPGTKILLEVQVIMAKSCIWKMASKWNFYKRSPTWKAVRELMAKAKLEGFFCKLSVYIKVWVFKDFLLIAKIIYIFIAENIKHWEKQKKKNLKYSQFHGILIPWPRDILNILEHMFPNEHRCIYIYMNIYVHVINCFQKVGIQLYIFL